MLMKIEGRRIGTPKPKTKPCPHCGGSGCDNSMPSGILECLTCKGHGYVPAKPIKK